MLKAEVTFRNDTSSDAKVHVAGDVHRWTSLADREGLGVAESRWKLEDRTDLHLKGASIVVPAHGEKTVTLEERASSLALWWQ
jgi:hypothetical protein